LPDARISVHDREPLRRRRLVVLLRVFLLFPHYVVLSIWALLLVPVLPIGWVAVLLAGSLPGGVHRFLAAFLRYGGQVSAWLYLLSATYPDPLHSREHPFAIDVPDREAQRRLVTLLRLPLAVLALVLSSAFGVILAASSVGAWFVALLLGRTTRGLQELGTFCLRYQLETQAYVLLLTSSYPKLEPPAPPAEQLLIPGLE
jgi:fatty acid desaturase